jgi:putative PIN family toxin of toxin-antitoxin system
MRVVLDTNILVSALMIRMGSPAGIYRRWEEGRFTLLTCAEQIEELKAILHEPRIERRILPYKAGRLINQLRKLAVDVGQLPPVRRSPDPFDDFLLATAEAGEPDYLVTGDKAGLLLLVRHHGTRILTARQFAALLK